MDDAGLGAELKQMLKRLLPCLSHIDGELADIHFDEACAEVRRNSPAPLQRVRNGLRLMGVTIRDAFFESERKSSSQTATEILSDEIKAERKGKPVRCVAPEFSEIKHFVVAQGLLGDLSLMDEETCINSPIIDRLHDAVKRHVDVTNSLGEYLEEEGCSG